MVKKYQIHNISHAPVPKLYQVSPGEIPIVPKTRRSEKGKVRWPNRLWPNSLTAQQPCTAPSTIKKAIEQSLDGTELQNSQENREHSETKT